MGLWFLNLGQYTSSATPTCQKFWLILCVAEPSVKENSLIRIYWDLRFANGQVVSPIPFHLVSVNVLTLRGLREVLWKNFDRDVRPRPGGPSFLNHTLGYRDWGQKLYPCLWKICQNHSFDNKKCHQNTCNCFLGQFVWNLSKMFKKLV